MSAAEPVETAPDAAEPGDDHAGAAAFYAARDRIDAAIGRQRALLERASAAGDAAAERAARQALETARADSERLVRADAAGDAAQVAAIAAAYASPAPPSG
ncbi:hypothetical protein LG943_14715 [Streptomonospora sp. S1-112]|uniref:Uncharacterized protein n=1 Tax=Streptomonospora mangrovi TaxID=2883123 RepID=A0A9X3SE57_9ACTN|nr:hypothetical protein [Streptomonospora mangrovi]MDA0565558.1 hypothetical protein [Streptomonospora mangrovi]